MDLINIKQILHVRRISIFVFGLSIVFYLNFVTGCKDKKPQKKDEVYISANGKALELSEVNKNQLKESLVLLACSGITPNSNSIKQVLSQYNVTGESIQIAIEKYGKESELNTSIIIRINAGQSNISCSEQSGAPPDLKQKFK